MLYSEGRRAARRDPEGRYVALDDQNRRLWDEVMIEEAEAILRPAADFARPGRFQIEAAIQSAHVSRLRGGGAGWADVVALYDGLCAVAPSIGAAVGRAAAIAERDGPAAALDTLAAVEGGRSSSYQPLHAARAHFLAGCGEFEAARAAYARAAGLTEDPAIRRWLLDRADALPSG